MNEEMMYVSDGAAVGAIGGVMLLIQIGLFLLMIVSGWKLFAKAGQPGWAILIPIYNIVVLLQVAGKPIWWILLMLIPLVNIVVLCIVAHAISVNFGRGVGTTLGLIFLPFIFYPILAFGSAQYRQ